MKTNIRNNTCVRVKKSIETILNQIVIVGISKNRNKNNTDSNGQKTDLYGKQKSKETNFSSSIRINANQWSDKNKLAI